MVACFFLTHGVHHTYKQCRENVYNCCCNFLHIQCAVPAHLLYVDFFASETVECFDHVPVQVCKLNVCLLRKRALLQIIFI